MLPGKRVSSGLQHIATVIVAVFEGLGFRLPGSPFLCIHTVAIISQVPAVCFVAHRASHAAPALLYDLLIFSKTHCRDDLQGDMEGHKALLFACLVLTPSTCCAHSVQRSRW